MAYKVEFLPSAARQLSKLDPPIQRRIVNAIDTLAENPRPPGVKKMVNEDNLWRLRLGDYRVTYRIYDQRLTILIVEVGHRREIYR